MISPVSTQEQSSKDDCLPLSHQIRSRSYIAVAGYRRRRRQNNHRAAVGDQPAVGLDQGHLWFVGEDEGYWDSAVKYQCPQEYEESLSGDPLLRTERIENAGDVTIGEMTRQLRLEQYDRICYLYDYGDEWRFYAILKEVLSDEPSDKEPAIVKEKGDPINDQYDPPETGGSDPPFLNHSIQFSPKLLSLLRIFVGWKSAIVSSTSFHHLVSKLGLGQSASGSQFSLRTRGTSSKTFSRDGRSLRKLME